MIAPGFGLPARHVIHAVGPIYTDGTKGEAALLTSAYWEALARAREAACRTIAFPAISTGAFRCPARDAATIALDTVGSALASLAPDAEAIFVLFDPDMLDVYREVAHRTLPRRAWRTRDPA